MNNKGGIIVSLEYRRTKFTFLSAHLAAHEGQSHYQTRCNNIHDIMRLSRNIDGEKKINLTVTSHHIFILGDLNFRTKIESNNIEDGNNSSNSSINDKNIYNLNNEKQNSTNKKNKRQNDAERKKSLEQAMKLVEAKNWTSLY